MPTATCRSFHEMHELYVGTRRLCSKIVFLSLLFFTMMPIILKDSHSISVRVFCLKMLESRKKIPMDAVARPNGS